jgi:uncharacterized protein YpmB
METNNVIPSQTLMIDKSVYIIIGATIVAVVISVALYVLYKKYMNESEAATTFENAKTDTKIDLNRATNTSIVDYLNTLKVVQGSDLTKLETDLKQMMNEMLKIQSKKIDKNKNSIRSNKRDILVNKFMSSGNKSNVSLLEDDMQLLRRSVSYNTAKIIIRFMDEYNAKFSSTSFEQDMVLNTNMFGLLDDNVYKLFDKYADKPDIFMKTHKEPLLNIVHLLMTQFEISVFYNDMDSINYTNYNSQKTPIETYIKQNHMKIDLTNHASYILKDYVPILLDYLNTNEPTIRNHVNNLMVNFYKDVPSTTHFNEFLTRLEVEEFIKDDTHLFTIILRNVLKTKYVNWANYKNELLKYNIFTKETMKLLFVLIPEYLIMIKYQSPNNIRKYADYIDSEYFLNISVNFLNQSNIKNFSNILSMFRCSNRTTNFNKKNDALKLTLSEGSGITTNRHTSFENMLNIYNTIVNNNPAAGVSFDLRNLTIDDFICEPDTISTPGNEMRILPIQTTSSPTDTI